MAGRLGDTNHVVKNSARKYARISTHVNTLECFWSHFKYSVKGTHRAISAKHMMKYLGEFEYRFNRRHEARSAMIDGLIQSF